MTDILNIRRINKAVCEALGLDPAKVQKVELCFDAKFPSIKVSSWVNNEKADALAAVLKEYRLVSKGDLPPNDA